MKNSLALGDLPNNGVMVQQDGMAMNFNSINQPIALNAPGRLPSGNYLWFVFDTKFRTTAATVSGKLISLIAASNHRF